MVVMVAQLCSTLKTNELYTLKDGHNKGQKHKDLTEGEEVKKRWQEYTEELYKKDLTDPDNHDGVVTHLEQDILDCEVKWSPLNCKEIQPVHPKGDQSWVFIGGTDGFFFVLFFFKFYFIFFFNL